MTDLEQFLVRSQRIIWRCRKARQDIKRGRSTPDRILARANAIDADVASLRREVKGAVST